jgi:lipoprotein NlpI
LIENKLKIDKDKEKLEEEKYQVVAFTIFGLVMFSSKAVGIISIETVNAFIKYEQAKNNSTLAILAETFLFLNHYRLHGKKTNMVLYSSVIDVDC